MEGIPSCFKAYDIRGRVPDELNNELAYRIGRVCKGALGVSRVAVGHDIRLSSKGLSDSLVQGLVDSGVDVVHLGLCGTEEIYHAAFSMESTGVDGGIIITASHNPADYNGMKFVTKGAAPVTGETGLIQIARGIGITELPARADVAGRVEHVKEKTPYIEHLLGYIDSAKLKTLKIVVNSGNGCAGAIVDLLAERLPCEFIRLNHEPDGTFPKGVPNPLLPDKRKETADAVKENGADLGIAWDGDFDRCFFWDENGRFIEGYYIVGLLAQEMLAGNPGASILYDPRLTWNTEEIVAEGGGTAVMTKTGHAFIKQKMREVNAVYGGEMSAHHYFRGFGYCDSGMIPWLLVASLLSRTGMKLSQLVDDRMVRFPVSGEINSTVADPDVVIGLVEEKYGDGEKLYFDGLSISYPDYRFNIRKSNTEPLLRLNVETRGDKALLERVTGELVGVIRNA